MLNHSLLVFTPAGQIIATNDLPVNFSNGTPTDALGQLCVDTASPVVVVLGGLGYTTSGALGAVTAAAAGVPHSGGLPVTDAGYLICEDLGVPVSWNGGIPCSADGRVCIDLASVPVINGFDNGFDNGFGI